MPATRWRRPPTRRTTRARTECDVSPRACRRMLTRRPAVTRGPTRAPRRAVCASRTLVARARTGACLDSSSRRREGYPAVAREERSHEPSGFEDLERPDLCERLAQGGRRRAHRRGAGDRRQARRGRDGRTRRRACRRRPRGRGTARVGERIVRGAGRRAAARRRALASSRRGDPRLDRPRERLHSAVRTAPDSLRDRRLPRGSRSRRAPARRDPAHRPAAPELHQAGTGRRGRRDLAVQRAAHPLHPRGRAGAGARQRGAAQAGPAHRGVRRGDPGAYLRGGGPACRPVQHAAGRRRRRRGDGVGCGRAAGLLHRLHARRSDGGTPGRRALQARAPGAGRQVGAHRPR